MISNLMDKIGDWNPQLLRELKGRLKPLNVAIAIGISLLGQLVTFLYQLSSYPDDKYSLKAEYCRLAKSYTTQESEIYQKISLLNQKISNARFSKPSAPGLVKDLEAQLAVANKQSSEFQNFFNHNYCPQNQIDFPLWWRDHWEYIFLTLSVVFIFTLLVAGTYLLINDLGKEERRGTLNFIRLSPQPESSILSGKILGVPILIYIIVLAALPLHFLAGHSAKIASSYILSYYAVMAACCTLFFSAALLFGISCRWFSGFLPWLGSGTVLIFLIMTITLVSSSGARLDNSMAWLRLFSPFDITNYLFPHLYRYGYNNNIKPLSELQFFYIPIGKNVVSVVGWHLSYYGLCIWGIWQSLQRSFRNPNASVLNKVQSYVLVAFCQVMMWGFTLQYLQSSEYGKNANKIYDLNGQIGNNIPAIALCNIVLIFGLIAVLAPHRQTIQDWARYRHHAARKSTLFADLLAGEKSPALVATAINLIFITVPLAVWVVLSLSLNARDSYNIRWLINDIGRMKALLGLALFLILMMIYTTIAQRMLLMKTSKRSLWAIGSLSALIIVPPMILQILSAQPSRYATLWLFSTFPWAGLPYSGTLTVFAALAVQMSILVLLNFQLTKKVIAEGESATKALLGS
jgi:hypothetical protein